METRFNRQKRSKSSSRMSYKTGESHVKFDIDVSLWGRKVGGFLVVGNSTGMCVFRMKLLWLLASVGVASAASKFPTLLLVQFDQFLNLAYGCTTPTLDDTGRDMWVTGFNDARRSMAKGMEPNKCGPLPTGKNVYEMVCHLQMSNFKTDTCSEL